MRLLQLNKEKQYTETDNDESQKTTIKRNSTIDKMNIAAVTCYAAAGAMLGTYVILAIIARRNPKRTKAQSKYSGLVFSLGFWVF